MNGLDEGEPQNAASELIAQLALAPHPEGGHYRRTYVSQAEVCRDGQSRPALTAIAFLLAQGERSAWHRVDAEEAWHWQQGAPLELRIFDPVTGHLQRLQLDAASHGGPAMAVVPSGCWQAARTLGAFTLVACTVSPGFVWEGFALLEPGSGIARAISAAGGDLD
ncbi:cupin domain-containing protein [Pseudoxanthomonas composti]|uniref:Cupin domain-containing protein n=1 Tax=Pseudoxanthomonas composti TaxID=2137479 RepID=A0A4Q1JZ92_9GAMM|nr:cupin domain-containing protein [Pseudoxanthomonas composti]RXR08487.1 cupin domain-containing protein [Pseudoxanthomonas composti]